MDNIESSAAGERGAAGTVLDERFVKMIRAEMRNVAKYDISEMRSTFKRPLVIEAIHGKVNEQTLSLASAALVIGFISRDIESESIKKLLAAVNIHNSPMVDMLLSVINFIKVKNHHPYLFAYYALEFAGRETSTTNVLHLVRGLGTVAADAKIAEQMVKFCDERKNEDAEIEYVPLGNEQLEQTFKKFHEIIINVYDTIGDFTIKEITEVTNRKLENGIPSNMYPYICAITTLSVCGRDSDMMSIEQFIDAMGIRPDQNAVRAIGSLRFRNQLAYVVSLYYLLSLGIEPTIDNMIRVVVALDLPPDAIVANKVLTYYNTNSAHRLA